MSNQSFLKIYIFLLMLTVIDQLVSDWTLHPFLIFASLGVVLVQFIQGLTKRIVLIEIISLVGCLIYLLMPLIAYQVFNSGNYFARLYESVMPTGDGNYFSLALPGTLLLVIGLNVSIIRQKASDIQLIDLCKQYLTNRKHLGVIMIITGLISSIMIVYAPSSIRAIVYFMSQLTFIGFLYLLHSNISGKPLIIGIALALLVGQSALTAMYGELVFWSVLGTIVLILGKRINYFKRVAVILVGGFLILVIQSVKHEYRLAMWGGSDQGSKPGVMLDLVKKKIEKPSLVFEPARIYAMVNRANQGFLVARTMEYVPKYEEFARGETIATAIAASLVPRFIWSDKPEVGGREMICRFLGDCRTLRYSYDIGQLGEGYVNFGIIGGAIFMFFYGLFIRTTYAIIANLSLTYHSLVLWIPLFFFSALSLETDVLTFINSFVKAVMFCFFIFVVFRGILKIKI